MCSLLFTFIITLIVIVRGEILKQAFNAIDSNKFKVEGGFLKENNQLSSRVISHYSGGVSNSSESSVECFPHCFSDSTGPGSVDLAKKTQKWYWYL